MSGREELIEAMARAIGSATTHNPETLAKRALAAAEALGWVLTPPEAALEARTARLEAVVAALVPLVIAAAVPGYTPLREVGEMVEAVRGLAGKEGGT